MTTTITQEGNGKRSKHYEDIDEFMVSSDKVNPDTDNILLTGNQDCGKKPEKRPATTAEGNSEVAEKLEKLGNRGERTKKRRRKGSVAMTWS